MRDRPILFSAPMVRAILDGRKTQTRRIVKNCGRLPEFRGPRGCNDDVTCWGWEDGETGDHIAIGAPDPESAHGRYLPCPHGVPGDRLWVREPFAFISDCRHDDPGTAALAAGAFYRADEISDCGDIKRWRPSIHMPRWASRITLEISSVRVQRLNDISAADALAEGMTFPESIEWGNDPKDAFFGLWEHLHGEGSWAANPWVWVVEFKRLTP